MSKVRYRLTARLDAGELSELFEADRDGEPVVIKLFHERYSDPSYGRQLADTGRRLNPLPHPGLVRYIELGVIKRRLAVVREAVDGQSLGAMLQRLNTREVILPSAVALHWVLELLDAVDCAHDAQVIHGAITPGNVLIDSDGTVRVCDFGALRALRAAPALKKAFGSSGRNSYRAPEVASGEAATVLSDVYSIGALAYELLTLREPSAGRGVGGSVRRDALPPPSRIDRRLNARLDPIVMRALEVVPGRRFRSCGELSQLLRNFIANNGGAPSTADLRKCMKELSPPAAPSTGELPSFGAFTLKPLDGADLEPLEERSVVLAHRPSFSGGEVRPGEFPQDAATVEAPPAFEEYRPEATRGERRRRPADEKTDPGQAGPLEQGWEAPPSRVVNAVKARKMDPELSVVTGRHSRVRVIEDFAPLEDDELSLSSASAVSVSRSRGTSGGRPPPKSGTTGGRTEARGSGIRGGAPRRSEAAPAEEDERRGYRHPAVNAYSRRLHTEERKLVDALRRNQKWLLVISAVALAAAIGFTLAIWRLHAARTDRPAGGALHSLMHRHGRGGR